MIESLQKEIINIAVVILTAGFTWVSGHIISYLKRKGLLTNIESKKELANIAVTAIEQVYAHYHGDEKFKLAKNKLAGLARDKGLKISNDELDSLIEHTVKKMNEITKTQLKDELSKK